MAIFYQVFSIISRSGGRSAVAASAYISAEKIYNERTGIMSDYRKKLPEIVHKGILLPDNAPERLRDRSVLWNEIEAIEKREDSQLSRSIIIALPKELNWDDCITLVEDYIKTNFTSRGMIADYAIHNKPNNPHVHIMLTMRGLDKKGDWLSKCKTSAVKLSSEFETKLIIPKGYIEKPFVYKKSLEDFYKEKKIDVSVSLKHDKEIDRDYISLKLNQEYDEDIKVPDLDPVTNCQKIIQRENKGIEHRWHRLTVPTNDWNDRSNMEIWRSSWADYCNKYLPAEEHIDHRSYKRQGLDIEPQIHEGYASRHMEENGKTSDRCRINREIRERNDLRQQLKDIGVNIIERVKKVIEYGKAHFGGNSGDSGGSNGTGNPHGNTTTSNRFSSGTVGGNDTVKRKIDTKDDYINNIKKRIDNLKQSILTKENELKEQLPEYKNRNSHNNEKINTKSETNIVRPSKTTVDIQNLLNMVENIIKKDNDKKNKKESGYT